MWICLNPMCSTPNQYGTAQCYVCGQIKRRTRVFRSNQGSRSKLRFDRHTVEARVCHVSSPTKFYAITAEKSVEEMKTQIARLKERGLIPVPDVEKSMSCLVQTKDEHVRGRTVKKCLVETCELRKNTSSQADVKQDFWHVDLMDTGRFQCQPTSSLFLLSKDLLSTAPLAKQYYVRGFYIKIDVTEEVLEQDREWLEGLILNKVLKLDCYTSYYNVHAEVYLGDVYINSLLLERPSCMNSRPEKTYEKTVKEGQNPTAEKDDGDLSLGKSSSHSEADEKSGPEDVSGWNSTPEKDVSGAVMKREYWLDNYKILDKELCNTLAEVTANMHSRWKLAELTDNNSDFNKAIVCAQDGDLQSTAKPVFEYGQQALKLASEGQDFTAAADRFWLEANMLKIYLRPDRMEKTLLQKLKHQYPGERKEVDSQCFDRLVENFNKWKENYIGAKMRVNNCLRWVMAGLQDFSSAIRRLSSENPRMRVQWGWTKKDCPVSHALTEEVLTGLQGMELVKIMLPMIETRLKTNMETHQIVDCLCWRVKKAEQKAGLTRVYMEGIDVGPSVREAAAAAQGNPDWLYGYGVALQDLPSSDDQVHGQEMRTGGRKETGESGLVEGAGEKHIVIGEACVMKMDEQEDVEMEELDDIELFDLSRESVKVEVDDLEMVEKTGKLVDKAESDQEEKSEKYMVGKTGEALLGKTGGESDVAGKQNESKVKTEEGGESGNVRMDRGGGGQQSTLLSYLRVNHPLPTETLRELTQDIVEGLACYHQRNEAYQDLHPENIVIENGKAKLRPHDSKVDSSMADVWKFKRSTAPDYAKTLPDDIYNLGKVLFWMAAQSTTFFCDMELVKRAVSEEPEERPTFNSFFFVCQLHSATPVKRECSKEIGQEASSVSEESFGSCISLEGVTVPDGQQRALLEESDEESEANYSDSVTNLKAVEEEEEEEEL